MSKLPNRGIRAAFDARELVRPFVRDFEQWRQRAAVLSRRLLAEGDATPDHDELVEQVRELTIHVEQARGAFRIAVAEQPAHSHIDDVDKAFQQILATLGRLDGQRQATGLTASPRTTA